MTWGRPWIESRGTRSRKTPSESMPWSPTSGRKATARMGAVVGLERIKEAAVVTEDVKKAAIRTDSSTRNRISRSRSGSSSSISSGRLEGTPAGLDQHVSISVAARQATFTVSVR